jgi:biopolymer transport protein ExbB
MTRSDNDSRRGLNSRLQRLAEAVVSLAAGLVLCAGVALAQEAAPAEATSGAAPLAVEAVVPAPAADSDPAVEAAPTASDAAAPAAKPALPAAKPDAYLPSALPHDLSPWGMFRSADRLVQAVMIGLAFASIVTWTVWLAKTIELGFAGRHARKVLERLAKAPTLRQAASEVADMRTPAAQLVVAAMAEADRSTGLESEGVKERAAVLLSRIEARAGRAMTRGTGALATIGATAPFVGLFGTVWGIMNSFIGISEAQTTNLAIVAPGIAEALLATAFGLIAAIPAVIVYNHFARAIGGYKALVGDASVGVLGLVSRDFDRGVRPELRAAE